MLPGKIRSRVLALLLAGTIPFVSVGQDQDAVDPMLTFQSIAAKLDPGGEVFAIIQGGRLLEQVLGQLEQGMDTGGDLAETTAEQDLRRRAGTLRTWVARQGIGGFRGIGLSIAARAREHSTLKLFLARDAVDAKLPFWRGVFGWQPRRLLSLDFLPSDTAMAYAGTPELQTLWEMQQEMVLKLGDEQTLQIWKQGLQAILDQAGLDADTFLQSLRDEVLLALRFDKQSGRPAFLLVVGVDDPLLHDGILTALGNLDKDVQKVALRGETLYRVLADGREPDDHAGLLPAFAYVPGFLVVSSQSQFVEDALGCQRHRNGLVSRPVFRDAFRGQNMVNNGLLYVSDEGAVRIRRFREHVQTQPQPGEPAWGAFEQHVLRWMQSGGSALPVCALTISNWRDGVMISGMSGYGGDTLLQGANAKLAAWLLQNWKNVKVWLGLRILANDAEETRKAR